MSEEQTPAPEEAGALRQPANNEFHLERFVSDGEVVIGFAGGVKYMRQDGSEAVLFVWNGLNSYEASGVYMAGAEFAGDAIRATFFNEDDE